MTARRRGPVALIAGAALALGAAGCGGGDEERAKEAVENFGVKAQSDPAALCDLLSGEALALFGDRDCAQAIVANDAAAAKTIGNGELEVTDSKVDGDRATVEAKDANEEFVFTLVREDDDAWKVDDIESEPLRDAG